MNCETLANHPNQEVLNNEVLSQLRTKTDLESCEILFQYQTVRNYTISILKILDALNKHDLQWVAEFKSIGLTRYSALLGITPQSILDAQTYLQTISNDYEIALAESLARTGITNPFPH